MNDASHSSMTKVYLAVFGTLAVLTVVTVSVSYFHLPVLYAVIIALLIASFKSSLVASFFMHLAYEKKIIFVILALAVTFFLALLLLPVFSHH